MLHPQTAWTFLPPNRRSTWAKKAKAPAYAVKRRANYRESCDSDYACPECDAVMVRMRSDDVMHPVLVGCKCGVTYHEKDTCPSIHEDFLAW